VQNKWRRGDQRRLEREDIEVVIQVLAEAAVPRLTQHTRMTLAVVTDAPEVCAGRIGQKDIGARVDPLRLALEPARQRSEPPEVDVVRRW